MILPELANQLSFILLARQTLAVDAQFIKRMGMFVSATFPIDLALYRFSIPLPILMVSDGAYASHMQGFIGKRKRLFFRWRRQQLQSTGLRGEVERASQSRNSHDDLRFASNNIPRLFTRTITDYYVSPNLLNNLYSAIERSSTIIPQRRKAKLVSGTEARELESLSDDAEGSSLEELGRSRRLPDLRRIALSSKHSERNSIQPQTRPLEVASQVQPALTLKTRYGQISKERISKPSESEDPSPKEMPIRRNATWQVDKNISDLAQLDRTTGFQFESFYQHYVGQSLGRFREATEHLAHQAFGRKYGTTKRVPYSKWKASDLRVYPPASGALQMHLTNLVLPLPVTWVRQAYRQLLTKEHEPESVAARSKLQLPSRIVPPIVPSSTAIIRRTNEPGQIPSSFEQSKRFDDKSPVKGTLAKVHSDISSSAAKGRHSSFFDLRQGLRWLTQSAQPLGISGELLSLPQFIAVRSEMPAKVLNKVMNLVIGNKQAQDQGMQPGINKRNKNPSHLMAGLSNPQEFNDPSGIPYVSVGPRSESSHVAAANKSRIPAIDSISNIRESYFSTGLSYAAEDFTAQSETTSDISQNLYLERNAPRLYKGGNNNNVVENWQYNSKRLAVSTELKNQLRTRLVLASQLATATEIAKSSEFRFKPSPPPTLMVSRRIASPRLTSSTSHWKQQESARSPPRDLLDKAAEHRRPSSDIQPVFKEKALSLRELRKMMEQIFQEELKRYGL